MKKFLNLYLLILFFCSCNQKVNLKYYWVSFNGSYSDKYDTTQIISLDKSMQGDTTIFTYVTKKGYLSYHILKNKDSSFVISYPRLLFNHPNDSIEFIRSTFDTSINFKKDTFRIKKFILDEFVFEGASIHYYEPTLGVYAVHYWPGHIGYLQTNDTSVNKKINMLIKSTIPKSLINGRFK